MSDTKWHDAPAIPQELRMAAEIERLTAERDDLRRLLSEWLRENSPGGWIDELRRQLADAIRERDELRGLIDAHNADCIAACKYKRENGNCLTYTEGGHVCVTCPRDEMIAQADAAMGLTRPAKEQR